MDFQLARLEEELGLGGIVGIGAIGGRLGCCEEGEVWRVGEVFRESCGESLVPASGSVVEGGVRVGSFRLWLGD